MAGKETQPEEVAEMNKEPSFPPAPGNLFTGPPAKTSWPELVGLTGEEAEKKIKQEMASVCTYIVPVDSMITFDLRNNRVRIFVDPSGKVVHPPRIG